jgi:hypothetical protein
MNEESTRKCNINKATVAKSAAGTTYLSWDSEFTPLVLVGFVIVLSLSCRFQVNFLSSTSAFCLHHDIAEDTNFLGVIRILISKKNRRTQWPKEKVQTTILSF